MKFKYFIIVSLILAILTLGAVSASDDFTSDDNLTVSEITQDSISESNVDENLASTQADESLSFEVEDFNASVEEEVNLDYKGGVVRVYCPENAYGSFVFEVDDDNYSFSIEAEELDSYVSWTLSSFDIDSAGEYLISLKYVPTEGDELLLLDSETLTVVSEDIGYGSDDFEFDSTDEISIYDFQTYVIYVYEFPCDGVLDIYVNSQRKVHKEILSGEYYYSVYRLDSLGINKTGTYEIHVNFTYGDNEVEITSFTLNVTDKLTRFNFNTSIRNGLYINSKVPVVVVECPEGIDGNITVNVDYGIVSKKINNTLMYFSLEELGINNSTKTYDLTVYYGVNNFNELYLKSNRISINENGNEYDYFISLNIPETVQIGDWSSTRISITKKESLGGIISLYVDNDFVDSLNLSEYQSFPTLDFEEMSLGEHSYNITYTGDGVHDAFNITGVFNVSYQLGFHDYVENPHYSQTTIIHINSYYGLEGDYVNLTVNGKTIKVEKGNYIEVKLDNLVLGENFLNLSYAGDSKYPARYVTKIINVTPVIQILNSDVQWNSSFESIILILPEDGVGELVIYENNEVIANSTLINGRAAISISNLTLGSHYIRAVNENGNYGDILNYGNVNIIPNIDVASVMSSKEQIIIPVKMPESFNGDLDVSVVTYTDYGYGRYEFSDEAVFEDEFSIVNGRGNIIIPKLNIHGNYCIQIEYVDDDVEYTYSVNKFVTFHNDTKDLKLNIRFDKEFVLGTDSAIVYLNLPEFHDGVVNVSINGTPFEIVLRETEVWGYYLKCLNLENLTSGLYEVTFNFYNDTYYSDASQKLTFSIAPINYDLDDLIEIQGNDYVRIALGKNVEGRLIIKIDGNETFNRIINKKYFASQDDEDYYFSKWDGIIKFKDLQLGIHNYELIFNWNNQNFTKTGIINVTYLLDIDVYDWDELEYGEDVVVDILLIDDAKSNVTINAAGRTYSVSPDDLRSIRLSGLAFGDNTIFVTYTGDDKYPLRTINTTIFVGPNFNISRYYSYSNDINMSISMIDDANGDFIVVIDNDDETTYSSQVINGKASVLIPALDMGSHGIDAYYLGDDYGKLDYNDWFYVVPEIIIPVLSDSGEYNITLNVPEDYDNDFEIYFNHKRYYGSFYDGHAIITLFNLTEGVYDLEITVYNEWGGYDYEYEIPNVVVRTSATDYELYVNVDKFIVFNSTEYVYLSLPSGATGNVTVKIDNNLFKVYEIGDEYDLELELPLGVRNLGVHTVEFIYSGDDYYISSNKTLTYNVTYFKFPEKVHAGYFDDENNNNYEIYAYDGLEGVVRISIDGVEIFKDFVYSYFQITLNNITSGIHNYEIKYSGDNNIAPFTQKGIFNATYNIYMNVDDIAWGSDAVIEVELPQDATGDVIITVGGKNYTKTLVNGKTNLTLPDLDVGEYEVIANYKGDSKYLPQITNTTFNVEYAIRVVVDKNNLTVILLLPEDAEGALYVSIDDDDYEVDITDGRAVFTKLLPIDSYWIYASCDSEDYEIDTLSKNIDIDADSFMTVEYPKNINIGDTQSINITLLNGKGNLTLYFEGEESEEKISDIANYTDVDGKITIPISLSKLGINYIRMIYETNDLRVSNYISIYADAIISVPEEIQHGDEKNITIEIPNDRQYNISVYIEELRGSYYQTFTPQLINHIAQITLPKLNPDTYGIRISCSGADDEEFTEFYVMVVNRETPEFDVKNSTNGIVIEFTTNVTGRVLVSVDDKEFVGIIENGEVVINDASLVNVGNVNVMYSGDKMYSSLDVEAKVNGSGEIIMVDPDLTISVNNITYSQSANITVTINSDIASGLIININNTNHTVTLSKGKGSVIISNLNAGTYDVKVIFKGNSKYNPLTKNTTLKVSKALNPVAVTVDSEYLIGSDFNITVSNITQVNVTINGDLYEIVDGKVVVDTTALSQGDYTVQVNASETANYLSNTTSKVFKITKPSIDLTVSVDNITYGENASVVVSIINATNADVVVNVDGVNHTVVFSDGVGRVNISDLDADIYVVKAIFVGNVYYDSFERNTTLKVLKASNPLTITVGSEYLIGSDFNITVSNITSVTVTINGDLYEIADGKVVVDTTSLSQGDYTVLVNASETTNYLANSTTKTFKITKTSIDLTVIADNITYGENASVVVSIINATNADVVVNVKGVNHTVVFNEGVGRVNISDLDADTYIVKAIFVGNAYYDSFERNTTLKVSKALNPITITVDSEYLIGSNFDILISNITPVNVTVGSTSYGISAGKVVIDTSTLSQGEYTIKAEAKETNNYLANSTTKTFKINKYNANLVVTTSDITLGETAIVNIAINENVTGRVVYSFNGVNSTVSIVNGKGNIILANLESGEYNIKVAFLGDNKYSASETTVSFKVITPPPTYDPRIVANNLSILYTSGALYTVQVYGTDGNVASGVLVQFKVNGVLVATAATDANGYASFKTSQSIGTYTIVSEALGTTITNKLTVSGILSLKSVSVKKSAKKLTLQATLKKVNGKYLKSKKITFKFNGKKYTAKTNRKGVAKVTIKKTVLKKLKVGKKINYQATYLKESAIKVVKVKK